MKTLSTALLCIFLINFSFAQTPTIKGKLPAFKYGLAKIKRPTKYLMYDTPHIATITTSIDKSGGFSFNLDQIDKELIILKITDSTENRTFLEQYFYIQKGYGLLLSEGSNNELLISGTGAGDNQLKGIQTYYNVGVASQDSVPDRIYKAIEHFYNQDKASVDSLSKTNQLSANCLEALNTHLRYARLSAFYNEYGNIRITKRDEVDRNHLKWESTFNHLQNQVAFSDEKALVAPSYHKYLETFLDRKFEDAQLAFYDKPDDFYKEWFAGDSLAAKASMEQDNINQLKQKIIERNFTGKVKEQMYALLFDSMVERQLYNNAETIFKDFKQQFPGSEFNQYFEKPINIAIARSKNQLTKKMVFLNKASTWNDILSSFKGKTVLIDMWGTWCAPCRQEINLHSAALKKHFANKNVAFLYVSNYDTDKEKWKQLIAFYNLEGNHIFASRELTAEIMKKIKGVGYPTYAIIDKHGKIELSKAGYPMERNVLIQQLEEAMNR